MSMTIDQAITRAYVHALRKPVGPNSGSTKYNALLAIADSMTKLWAMEPSVEWSSLYSLVTLTPTVTATDTFAIDATINDISNREGDYVLLTNGTNTQRVILVSPDQLYQYKDQIAAAKIGSNLKFSKAFVATDSVFGYNIKVPALLYPTDITAGSQTVQVDDPMWLVYMMAAEFCRNDVVKQGQYDNLLALAEQSMEKMKQTNGGQMAEVATPWTPAGAEW